MLRLGRKCLDRRAALVPIGIDEEIGIGEEKVFGG